MVEGFTVSGRIAKSVHEVYEAVADPDRLSEYFTTGGAVGRMESGATVQWDFADFPGAFPVEVVDAVADERIVMRWDGQPVDDGPASRTTVTFGFSRLDDGRTLVTITEDGWNDTPDTQHVVYGNVEGWTGMLCAMKVWLEHGIRLRPGFYQ